MTLYSLPRKSRMHRSPVPGWATSLVILASGAVFAEAGICISGLRLMVISEKGMGFGKGLAIAVLSLSAATAVFFLVCRKETIAFNSASSIAWNEGIIALYFSCNCWASLSPEAMTSAGFLINRISHSAENFSVIPPNCGPMPSCRKP